VRASGGCPATVSGAARSLSQLIHDGWRPESSRPFAAWSAVVWNVGSAVKVLVHVKRVIDYNSKVCLKPDVSGIDLANVKMSKNPFDEILVKEALGQREAGKATQAVVVSIGPAQSVETLRTSLAMGADRGIHVKVDGVVEPLAVAKSSKASSRPRRLDRSSWASRGSTATATRTAGC